jgi:hypothetical protein
MRLATADISITKCTVLSCAQGQAVVQNQTDFSPCFEDTALLFVPCIFLFLVAALQFCFDGYVHRPIPVSRLHVAKSVRLLIFVMSVISSVQAVNAGRGIQDRFNFYVPAGR